MSEINIDGVFFSGALASACIAAVALFLARLLLLRAGFYRHVWHRHLVDLALFTILWAVASLVTNQLMTFRGL
jgi:hypothetical protein